jgi:hypothetical protein
MKAVVSSMLLLLCVLGYSESTRAEEAVRIRPVDVYISGFGVYSFPLNTDVSIGGFTIGQDVEF